MYGAWLYGIYKVSQFYSNDSVRFFIDRFFSSRIFMEFPWFFEIFSFSLYFLLSVTQQQTNWMLPALCYNIFKLFILAVGIILVPILGFVYAIDIQKFINDTANKTDRPVMPTVFAFVTAAWISVAIATGSFGVIKIFKK